MNKGLANLKPWLSRLGGGRSAGAALAVGVILLAVPTVYTLFPGLAEADVRARGGVLAAWVATAVVSVGGALSRDRSVTLVAEELSRQLARVRRSAHANVLDAILRRGSLGLPDHYALTAYLYDGGSDRLVPIWPAWDQPGEDPRIFPPGCGATGVAWQRRATTVVAGSAVSGPEYGLTALQQRFFRSFKVVIAVPVFADGEAADDDPIGVVAAISKERLAQRDELVIAAMRNLAETFGTVTAALRSPSDVR